MSPRCPTCGADVMPDDIACPACGQQLDVPLGLAYTEQDLVEANTAHVAVTDLF